MWERYSKNDLTASEPAKTLNQLVSWQLQQKKKAVGKKPQNHKTKPKQTKKPKRNKTHEGKSEQSIMSERDLCTFFFLARLWQARTPWRRAAVCTASPQKLPGMENPSFLQQEAHCVCVYAWGHAFLFFWLAGIAKELGYKPKLCTVLRIPELWAVWDHEMNVAEHPLHILLIIKLLKSFVKELSWTLC